MHLTVYTDYPLRVMVYLALKYPHGGVATIDCAIFPACNLRRRLYRAVDAFLHELDTMTLREAIAAPTVAATVLGIAEHRELVPDAAVSVSRPRGGTNRRAGVRQ